MMMRVIEKGEVDLQCGTIALSYVTRMMELDRHALTQNGCDLLRPDGLVKAGTMMRWHPRGEQIH